VLWASRHISRTALRLAAIGRAARKPPRAFDRPIRVMRVRAIVALAVALLLAGCDSFTERSDTSAGTTATAAATSSKSPQQITSGPAVMLALSSDRGLVPTSLKLIRRPKIVILRSGLVVVPLASHSDHDRLRYRSLHLSRGQLATWQARLAGLDLADIAAVLSRTRVGPIDAPVYRLRLAPDGRTTTLTIEGFADIPVDLARQSVPVQQLRSLYVAIEQLRDEVLKATGSDRHAPPAGYPRSR